MKLCIYRWNLDEPLIGQLPPDRVTPFVRPFSFTGVDLFGPFNVTIGRRKDKRWAVIFTCLMVRVAHIEVADDLVLPELHKSTWNTDKNAK